MIKQIIKISFIVFLFSGPKAFAPNIYRDINYQIIQENLDQQFRIDQEILFQKNLRNFKAAIAAKESSNNWKEYNPYGYIGKFQFGKAALEVTGYGHVDFIDFINNPAVFPERDQERAMDSLLKFNEFILEPYIQEFEDQTFLDSVKITRTGLLAAAHLAGPGNVKRFLNTSGRHNPTDQMGTQLSDYLITFGAHFH